MKKLTNILLFTLLISVAMSAQKTKEAVLKKLDSQTEKYGSIAMQIWDLAEMGYLEEQSSSLLQETLSKEGFTIKKSVADIPTAFVAEYGSGKPIIGIMGEFDANLGISQKKQPIKDPLEKGAPGHGCGHNLFGTASLGAAIAIKEMIESGEIFR